MLNGIRTFVLALISLSSPAVSNDCNTTKLREAMQAMLAAREHLFAFEEIEPMNAEAIGSLHSYLHLLNLSRRITESCKNPEAQAVQYRLMLLERTALQMLSMANKAAASDFAWMIKRERVNWTQNW